MRPGIRFLELTASGPGSDRGGLEAIEGVAGLAAHLSGGMLERDAQGEVILPGLRLASSLVDDMLAGRMMRQVFLKQFRDAADGNRACYQSVVEAPVDVKRARHAALRARLGSHDPQSR